MRVGVVTFPGSLDDVDAQRAVRFGGHEAVALWHGDHDLRGVDAVVLPGGFSYGDYLRCGAIARFAPVMSEVVDPEVYNQLLRSPDEGIAEFLDLARVKPNTLGNTRMMLEL